MSNSLNFLAFDLGAESGRAMLGRLADGRLNLSEVHRFANGPVRVPDKAGHVSLHWDVLHLWNEIQQGIALAGREGPLAGIGVDTWGVDFGLLNRHGRLIGNPVPLPGWPDRRHAGRGVPPGAACGDLRADRHPVPADQLALSVVVDDAQRRARAGGGGNLPPHAEPLQLLAVGPGGLRVQHRHHDAVLQPTARWLGDAAPRSPGDSDGHLPRGGPGRHGARAAANRPGGGAGRRSRPDHRARQPRHRLRRGRSARRRRRAPRRLRLDQLGHLVGDGRRAGRTAHHAAKPGV